MLVTIPANDAVTSARLPSDLEAEIVDLDSSAASQPGLGRQENGSLLRLQRHIFNDVVAAPQAKLDDQVVIFSAPGESRECVEIVRPQAVRRRKPEPVRAGSQWGHDLCEDGRISARPRKA